MVLKKLEEIMAKDLESLVKDIIIEISRNLVNPKQAEMEEIHANIS